MEASGNPFKVESADPTFTSPTDNSGVRASPPSINGNSHLYSTMSQQSLPAVDVPEMDDAMSIDVPLTQHASPARATTSTSGRGRGRGRWTRGRNAKVTKPAQQRGAPAGRGRRQKVYDSLKVQAAHERAQELKQAFAAVGKLVKPAIQEIADRSINELMEDPEAHKKVPQHAAIQDFLRQRHEDRIRECDAELEANLAMAKHVYEAECEKRNERLAVSFNPPR
jgi:hypothetical protein